MRWLYEMFMNRELGYSSLKASTQVDGVAKKAYGMLASIDRGTEYKSFIIMFQFYKTPVMLHLGYHMHFWSPHNRKDVSALRFTRLLSRLENLS